MSKVSIEVALAKELLSEMREVKRYFSLFEQRQNNIAERVSALENGLHLEEKQKLSLDISRLSYTINKQTNAILKISELSNAVKKLKDSNE